MVNLTANNPAIHQLNLEGYRAGLVGDGSLKPFCSTTKVPNKDSVSLVYLSVLCSGFMDLLLTFNLLLHLFFRIRLKEIQA